VEIPGKVTIITGASAGIGLAAARRFAGAGARVVLVARSADKLSALAEELRQQGHDALPLPADMRDPVAVGQMVEQAFQRYGSIDILINNAGQAAAGTVAAVSPDDFRQIIELNVFGPLYAIQAAVPKMRQGGGGMIINVSSMVSRMHIPGLAAYASTKAALNMLSDTARVELASDNIRVITVYPRLIEWPALLATATDFGRNSLGDQRMRQGQRQPYPGDRSRRQPRSGRRQNPGGGI
jgi:NAD(P)-dependent dehydrogenase (short-subunit alcohol dehydrogenase family)